MIIHQDTFGVMIVETELEDIGSHEALGGKTPADMASIKVEGQNKWITLIQNASKTKL